MTDREEPVARHKTADGYTVLFWADGAVTNGMQFYPPGIRKIPIEAMWAVAGEVELFDWSEVPTLMRAARRIYRRDGRVNPGDLRRETSEDLHAEAPKQYEENVRSLELGVGEVDEKASASLARIKLRAKYRGDLNGAIISAGYYAQKFGHTMYVYEGTSYMHIVYRVSDRPSEYLNPINNTGSAVASVTPDLIVSKHDVVR